MEKMTKEQLLKELPALRQRVKDLGTQLIASNWTNKTELDESLQKYRVLFEATHEAIIMIDPKGFFDLNKAALDMFGCSSKEEFFSINPKDLEPPVQPDGRDSFSFFTYYIEKALKEGSVFFECFLKKVDGTIFPVEILYSRIDFEGRDALQALVRDISERKRLMKNF